MGQLNYDPRPPERQGLERGDHADKVAETFIEFGKLFIALGVTVLAIIVLIAMI